jgi:tRNA threonylcarbamoyladenosine biosynthesis protein TsaE
MKVTSKTLADTRDTARFLLDSLSPASEARVVALQGDLGAGKTAFTQEVGKLLGITESMQSPTFVIMKIYPIDFKGFKNFIHIDAYRLEHESELLHLGWQMLTREPENLIFIEWPERVAGIMPPSAKKINFTFVDESTRDIEYES